MKSTLRKEVRPITFDKIIVELEKEERDILLKLLDRVFDELGDTFKLDSVEHGILSRFRTSLKEPELVKEPEKKSAAPKMKTDDLNPTDPKFKTKVLERMIQNFPLPNVRGVDQWKTGVIGLITSKRKEITVRPKSMKDDDFFDWLVEANFLDKSGNPVDQTKTTKDGPVKK